jgi:hypothetical protein
MDDRVVFPTLELLRPVRGLCLLATVEFHALTYVRHGCVARNAQPGVLHVVTWSGSWQKLFYFLKRRHYGARSFSSSRRLYRKKPDKLG